MNHCRFENITPINGFDAINPDNAMQNNYAWSMAEFNGYLYVGTGRNIPYFAILNMGIEPPNELTPQNPSNTAEIWRYPLFGRRKRWERVYKAPQGSGIMGFRYMITYTNDDEVTALYCAGFSIDNSTLLMTTNGTDYIDVSSGIPNGFSTRAMAVYKNKLYTGATNALDYSSDSYLYVTENPEDGWRQIDFGDYDIPTGEIVSMISFNGYLYIGTSPAGGFEVWKSADPENGKWKLVVDKGAGDALNEVPMCMEVFKNHLYVGTGIWLGFDSVDPDKSFVPPKGFDVIKINKNDSWKVVVGGTPISPTRPTTGRRNHADYPSGFGNMFNSYCWQIRAFKGKLYIGSWDSAVLFNSIIMNIINNIIGDEELSSAIGDDFSIDDETSVDRLLQELTEFSITDFISYNWIAWLRDFLCTLKKYPHEFGFDLFESSNGEDYCPITLNGFNNQYNYGLRTMLVTKDNCKMFLGTANPYEGCEVWMLK